MFHLYLVSYGPGIINSDARASLPADARNEDGARSNERMRYTEKARQSVTSKAKGRGEEVRIYRELTTCSRTYSACEIYESHFRTRSCLHDNISSARAPGFPSRGHRSLPLTRCSLSGVVRVCVVRVRVYPRARLTYAQCIPRRHSDTPFSVLRDAPSSCARDKARPVEDESRVRRRQSQDEDRGSVFDTAVSATMRDTRRLAVGERVE